MKKLKSAPSDDEKGSQGKFADRISTGGGVDRDLEKFKASAKLEQEQAASQKKPIVDLLVQNVVWKTFSQRVDKSNNAILFELYNKNRGGAHEAEALFHVACLTLNDALKHPAVRAVDGALGGNAAGVDLNKLDAEGARQLADKLGFTCARMEVEDNHVPEEVFPDFRPATGPASAAGVAKGEGKNTESQFYFIPGRAPDASTMSNGFAFRTPIKLSEGGKKKKSKKRQEKITPLALVRFAHKHMSESGDLKFSLSEATESVQDYEEEVMAK